MTQPAPKAEQKLLKVVHKYAALEAELQLIIPPKIFNTLSALCRDFLEHNKYDDPSRDFVSRLAFVFRQEAYMRFGHECLETFALAKLLKQAEAKYTPKLPRLDSVSWIRAYRNRNSRLDSDQEDAAEHIKRVWVAFGRFQGIAGSGLSGGGGGGSRGRAMQPIDVMDQELWDHHRLVYTPWYNTAKMVQVDRRRGKGRISLAAIVLKILVGDMFPEEMDQSYALVRGTSLRALKAALSAYNSPEALAAYRGPEDKPVAPPQCPTKGKEKSP